MNCYEIWVDLQPGVNDLEFAKSVQAYLSALQSAGKLASFRIRRRKLGFGPAELGEWNITLEYRDLHQLEESFEAVATRSGEVEELHHAVYSRVRNFKSGLYRDFPDPVRVGPPGS